MGRRQSRAQSRPRLNQTPRWLQFGAPEALFAVFAHGLFTRGSESRLNRTFGERFGDTDYAKKKNFIGWVGAAMLCARILAWSRLLKAMQPTRPNGLTVLKSTNGSVFKASSAAAKAVALLMGKPRLRFQILLEEPHEINNDA